MPTGSPRPPRRAARRGFTYLWLLFALTLGGVALAALGEQALTQARREREAELRFRGQAIARALALYAERTPVGKLPLPQQLEDLLADPRFPKPLRHLRQLYADPFTGRADWELVWGQAAPVEPTEGVDTPTAPPLPVPGTRKGRASAPSTPLLGSGIVGVRSSSHRRLLATRGLQGRDPTAHDWVFLAQGPPPPQMAPKDEPNGS